MGRRVIQLRVNGRIHEVAVAETATLADAIREIGLTGTKQPCEDGSCGGCAVLADDVAILSCCRFAASAVSNEITTVEGLAQSAQLTHLQMAIAPHLPLMCGFCTSGLLIAGSGLLERNPEPTERDIRDALRGCNCRCGSVEVFTNVLRQLTAPAGERR